MKNMLMAAIVRPAKIVGQKTILSWEQIYDLPWMSRYMLGDALRSDSIHSRTLRILFRSCYLKAEVIMMINDHETIEGMTMGADVSGRDDGRDMGNEEVISILNDLIQTCKDGQEGFREAAEGVERSDLRTFFNACSLERAGFAGELQTLVRDLGGDPEDEGSFAGALHRGWIDLKAAVTGSDDEALLAECERGEDSAKSAYNKALKERLPENIRRVVDTQAIAVRDKHDRIKALRDFAIDHSGSATDHIPNDRSYDTARPGLI